MFLKPNLVFADMKQSDRNYIHTHRSNFVWNALSHVIQTWKVA